MTGDGGDAATGPNPTNSAEGPDTEVIPTLPGFKLILREYYEPIKEGDWRDHILRGWPYRCHVAALFLERFACFVRGHHDPCFEPDWREWFCKNCGEMNEKKLGVKQD